MSRLPLLFLALNAPAAAQNGGADLTAEQAYATYRQAFDTRRRIDCPPSADPEDLVVCAPRVRTDRLPLPVEREPGEPIRLQPGEAPRAHAGYGDSRYCFSRCAGTVGLDLGTAIRIVNGIRDAIEDD